MDKTGVVVGTYAKDFAENSDETRITRQNREVFSEKSCSYNPKRAQENQLFEESENLYMHLGSLIDQ